VICIRKALEQERCLIRSRSRTSVVLELGIESWLEGMMSDVRKWIKGIPFSVYECLKLFVRVGIVKCIENMSMVRFFRRGA